jgi:hypothetical protein
VQVAAAVALSLAAAKDYNMQESARHLGAIPPLVDLAAGFALGASEVGRLALLSLRHRNGRNGREVEAVVRGRRCAAAAAAAACCSADSEVPDACIWTRLSDM